MSEKREKKKENEMTKGVRQQNQEMHMDIA